MRVGDMSKFIEKLQQVLTPPVQSMGFMTAKAETARPKIQLVVNITGAKAKSQIKDVPDADALLISSPAAGNNEKITGMLRRKAMRKKSKKRLQRALIL